MSDDKQLQVVDDDVSIEIVKGVTINSIQPKLEAIKAFQKLVKTQLQNGHDYGTQPGTNKPTLFKPGAEKIAKLLSCADKYEIISEIEDWNKPLFAYKVKCRLVTIGDEVLISEGLGACNSYEGKYRYRWVYDYEIPSHLSKEDLIYKNYDSKKGYKYKKYRIENEDIFTLVNTFLKMAKKRALVDAALSAGRLSDLFTQDIEDIKDDKSDINVKPDTEAPEIDETKETPKKEEKPVLKPEGTKMSTEAQIKAITATLMKNPETMSAKTNEIVEKYKVEIFTELTYEQAGEIIKSFTPKRAE